MTDASFRAVARRLQTACSCIEKLYLNEWTVATAEGRESLMVVRHMAKRLKSSSEGYWDGLPVFETDVDPGLEDDCLNDMNDLMNSVSSKMQVLAEVQQKVQKHLTDCEELYNRLCSPESSSSTSCHQSIEILISKIHEINDQLAENYEDRKVHLNSVSWNDLTSIEKLIDAWERRSESRRIKFLLIEATCVTSAILQRQE